MDMRLYDIDAAIESLIDEQTGEVLDYDVFLNHPMERDKKIENIALWIKNLDALSNAIAKEKKVLNERKLFCENRALELRERLSLILNGAEYKSAQALIQYHDQDIVVTDDKFLDRAVGIGRYIEYPPPMILYDALLLDLRRGKNIEGAWLQKKKGLVIK